jgi:hypothetical protein
MKNVSMLVAQVGTWNAKLCSTPVEMIMHQKPSDRSIFCQSISQVQSVLNMNFRMDVSAGPSALTPDWSSAGSVMSLTDDWRGGLQQVDFVAFLGSGSQPLLL